MSVSSERATITVWLCDECGYWRKDKSTGVHQTSSPDDPNGKLIVHELREAEFVLAGRLEAAERERDDYRAVNESVSVCAAHTSEIVGPVVACWVCAADEAQERALAAEARVERLEEALREIANEERADGRRAYESETKREIAAAVLLHPEEEGREGG